MKTLFSKSNKRDISGIALFIAFLLFLASCEKEVKINLPAGEQHVVVEGAIETGLPPYVILTNTVSFFSTIDINTLQNSFLHGAAITVFDGSKTIKLKEYSIDTGAKGNKFYFYSIDTAVKPFMVGEVEKYYKLHIEYNGQIYEATTKIPNPTNIDSVRSVLPDPPFNTTKHPDARQIRVYFQEPDTPGNYIRYFTKRNSELYYAPSNSVYNDEIVNGIYFQTTLELGEPAGVPRDSTSGVAYPGDTVTLKWCAIDKAAFNFWNTYEYSLGSIGNPFSTPIQVTSNLSNSALGIWVGYGSVYKTVVIH